MTAPDSLLQRTIDLRGGFTMTYSVEEKETFYQELTHIVLKVPREDKLLIL